MGSEMCIRDRLTARNDKDDLFFIFLPCQYVYFRFRFVIAARQFFHYIGKQGLVFFSVTALFDAEQGADVTVDVVQDG